MRQAVLWVNSQDIIVQCSQSLLNDVGDIRGMYGWQTVTLPCGRCATAKDAEHAHGIVRGMGEARFSNFHIRGPKGTIYVVRARLCLDLRATEIADQLEDVVDSSAKDKKNVLRTTVAKMVTDHILNRDAEGKHYLKGDPDNHPE